MDTKLYAPRNWDFLTITDHPGQLRRTDLVWNIMRMILMSDEELNAQEAIGLLDEMEMEEFNALKSRAEAELIDWDMQKYLDRKGDPTGQELFPIEEVLTEEGETPMSEKKAKEYLMSELDNLNWKAFLLWELPEPEWE